MKENIVVYVLSGGQWVEVIKMKIENPSEFTEEEIQKALGQIHELFYKGDKVKLNNNNQYVSFRGIENTFNIIKVIAE